jgi:GDP-4-dehydro-6-deoxy-D-mannose reductase
MPDLIFHLAAQAYVAESTTDPLRGYEVNCLGTVNVLEAVRQTGCPARILVTGTSEEYGYRHAEVITEDTLPAPSTPYGSSKLCASTAALVYHEQFGLPVVVTRAFNHTGPGQSPAYAVSAFARRIARVERGLDTEMVHGDLSAIRDVSDVRDVVCAYAAAIKCEPGVYNVCREIPQPMQQIVDHLIELARVPIPTKLDIQLHRPSAVTRFHSSYAKLNAATGWVPKIPMSKTLTDLLDYWREMI